MKRELCTLFIVALSFAFCANAAVLPSDTTYAIAMEQNTITGTVTDPGGMPLPGVNVLIEGTSTGAQTDFDGNFTIEATQGDVLVFSYLGMKPQNITVGTSNSIEVTLEENASELDEVVVVGYGKQSKESLTGAVTQIDNKTLQDRPITNVSEGLQGSVGNLNITTGGGGGNPNSTKNINIRGFTGLGQTQGPLIVIDGIQGGDINAINPNDIESISVIKDAASAAVYGSSAPYGVILITTKKGKKGAEPQITLNSNFSGASPIGLPDMLNSITFANMYNEALANAGRSPFFSDEAIERMRQYQAGTLKDETIPVPAEGADQYYGWGGANANNDWFDIYYKNISFSQQHNLGITGGSEKSTYFVGAGYNERNGLYRYGDDVFKRVNIRANLSTDVKDWLTFSLRTAYARESYNTVNAGGNRTGNNWMHQIARKHPNIPLRTPDGNYSDLSDVPFHENGGRRMDQTDNPIITGEVEVKLADSWDFTTNYTYNATFFRQSQHTKTLFHTLPSGEQRKTDWTYPNRFYRYMDNTEKLVLNAFTNYRLNLGKHNLKFLLGYVRESEEFLAFSGANNNLYSDDLPSLNLTYGTNPSISDNIRKFSSQGVFGRINYDYDGRYLLEVVGRYDGTSRFLEDQRWKLYPGVSAGWNIHREEFWNDELFINTVKIRGSYGSLGDQSLSVFGDDYNRRTYPFYPNLGISSPTGSNWVFNQGREAAVSPPGLVDPSLTWITTTTLDFGVDATFFDRRLSATFDWYKRKADDYIGPSESLPGVLGTAPPVTNSAALETTGFELSLEWRDNIGDDFEYGVKGILSDYTGKVTKFPNPEGIISNNNWNVGQKMGEIWGYETDRYFTSTEDYQNSPDQSVLFSEWGAGDIKYADLNGDGVIDYGTNTLEDHGDKKIIGNNTPRYSYSFLGDAKYKNFDLSFFIQGVGKRDAWLGGNYFFGITGSEWQSSPFSKNLDRWTEGTPNGYFPKYYMSGQNDKNTEKQTKYLQSAAYMRIKNIQVGFTFPQPVLDNFGAAKLRIYVSADNLATFSSMSKHSSLDPELSIDDSKIYPLQRTYSLGINISL